jgi:hypothetical protein
MHLVRNHWPQRGNCFILMPSGTHVLRDGQAFDWDSHYGFLADLIRLVGMIPIRADHIYGPEPALERLWQGIQEAEVIVADVTGRNPNVLFELGVAHVIGKQILVLTMDPDDIPAGFGQFVQLHYSKERLLHFAIELKRNLEAVRKMPSAEALLVPFPGAGGSSEAVSARVLSVTPTFAVVETSDGRRGFLSSEDFSWTRKSKDLTRVLRIGQELSGAFVSDLNGQPRYSLIAREENPGPGSKRSSRKEALFAAWLKSGYRGPD